MAQQRKERERERGKTRLNLFGFISDARKGWRSRLLAFFSLSRIWCSKSFFFLSAEEEVVQSFLLSLFVPLSLYGAHNNLYSRERKRERTGSWMRENIASLGRRKSFSRPFLSLGISRWGEKKKEIQRWKCNVMRIECDVQGIICSTVVSRWVVTASCIPFHKGLTVMQDSLVLKFAQASN